MTTSHDDVVGSAPAASDPCSSTRPACRFVDDVTLVARPPIHWSADPPWPAMIADRHDHRADRPPPGS
jgi:hypothetical protein